MTPLLISDSLAHAVDDHVDWISTWHRLLFLQTPDRDAQIQALIPPQSFELWRDTAMTALPQDQPAIEKLSALHEQLHTLAKLVLLKTQEGKTIVVKDYDTVIAKYQDLMKGLRRMERAFSVAASSLDLLTGLRSRMGLEEDLHREYSRFKRTGKTFCIAIMDIDHFKKINDTHGHDAGDRALAAVADHISRSLRPFDDAYRIGGEEFLLALKEADTAIGLLVLERLRIGLEKKPVILADGTALSVTASFGLAVSDPEIEPSEMLKKADQALYKAKNEGRNRIVRSEPSPAVPKAG